MRSYELCNTRRGNMIPCSVSLHVFEIHVSTSQLEGRFLARSITLALLTKHCKDILFLVVFVETPFGDFTFPHLDPSMFH